ncbi:galactose oxidase [Gloeophyllum trabeum ATCC 11539]|uniref:Galactose oxidase n=1 Tax=Gloeophyllum trabeum (strain ATCC 11539 / FP-39264 / Madison 617) TaxID=670483 RepID=S7QCL5_GLOTA|nr:galactose oxidase [Gloeophyllum trabeum ATCC 11539]EPQ57092.1 galactose oxidase [Gloeophyllum trabeum ATCC 11539]
MREFKVYVGMTEDRMVEALDGGLKNDSFPETFPLKHTNAAGLCFPARFVKIVPLSAHGQSFHTSIWYVALSGIADHDFVERAGTVYEEYLESVTLRRILKHLRQRRLLTPYQSLLSRVNVQLEHPLVSRLYEQLVLRGVFPSLNDIVQAISDGGLLDSYLYLCQPGAVWKRLDGCDADGDKPSKRSAHAMCMDEDNGMVYLLGGWDGEENLDDFWVYDVKEDTWRVLSHNTSEEKNGPGRRSCHKMVFDKKTGCIYVLGRMGDEEMGGQDVSGSSISNGGSSGSASQQPQETSGSSPCSEFYRYHTRGLDIGKWDLLSFDTASGGGPPLIFDHQMAIDSEMQMIYVFGGRVVDQKSIKYSGLYSYNIRTNKWKMLHARSSHEVSIPPRSGHSMVLEPNSKTLIIFAGQREEKYLSDMYTYHIETGTVTEVFSDYTMDGGPKPCFTQRAVLDPDLREIYVFCGLSRQLPGNQIVIQSQAPHWVYRYPAASCSERGKWMRLVHADSASGPDTPNPEDREPKPRYAHQLAYDRHTKTVFMHGGNAGIREGAGDMTEVNASTEEATKEEKEIRLDDFWSMQLQRPPRTEVARKVLFEIRKQQFREMCEDDTAIEALNFLRDEVSSVVDHTCPEEEDVFQSLLSHLVAQSPRVTSIRDSSSARQLTDDIPSMSFPLGDADVEMSPPPDATDSPESSSGPTRQPPLTWEEDPKEKAERGDGPVLSAERFKQRTEVFERILTFINEGAKQPDDDLIHLIDGL